MATSNQTADQPRRFRRLSFEWFEDRLMLAATWPVPASHEMSFGFAAGSPGSWYDFHEGIDILASGSGGEAVVAARGGMVWWNNPGYVGGYVVIRVDVGGGTFEYDGYLHGRSEI
jgi:murein DD-endopeptidase MepM/ murein hydrolase activator NlpD